MKAGVVHGDAAALLVMLRGRRAARGRREAMVMGEVDSRHREHRRQTGWIGYRRLIASSGFGIDPPSPLRMGGPCLADTNARLTMTEMIEARVDLFPADRKVAYQLNVPGFHHHVAPPFR